MQDKLEDNPENTFGGSLRPMAEATSSIFSSIGTLSFFASASNLLKPSTSGLFLASASAAAACSCHRDNFKDDSPELGHRSFEIGSLVVIWLFLALQC